MALDKNGKKLPKGIIQRADGLYMGRFQYEGELYPSIYDRDMKVVEKKLNDLRYEVTHQMYTQSSKVTVSEWFDIWLKDYRGIRIKPGTKEVYQNTFNARIKPVLGKKKMTSVRMDQIQKLYNDMAEKNYAEGTIKLVGVVLYGMFKQAVKTGLITKNPAAMATIPKAKERKERIAMNLGEQKQFQDYAIKYSEYYRIFLIALCTGMRNGEVRGLCWSDMDFDNKLIHVTGTLKYVKDRGHYKGSPKTKTSKRDIPMLGLCYDLLKEQREKQEEQKKLAGKWWEPLKGLEELVFTSPDGKPVSRERVTKELNEIINKMHEDHLDMPEFTFHTLRHTFATRGLEQGISLKVMQVILGHKALAMTADLYSHVLPTTKAKEMEKMEDVFK
ncbi:MAG: site-specific integrase [Hungatella sp.]|jgi:integrase|nr:site-specific integrase [Hungatella sp.]